MKNTSSTFHTNTFFHTLPFGLINYCIVIERVKKIGNFSKKPSSRLPLNLHTCRRKHVCVHVFGPDVSDMQ